MSHTLCVFPVIFFQKGIGAIGKAKKMIKNMQWFWYGKKLEGVEKRWLGHITAK